MLALLTSYAHHQAAQKVGRSLARVLSNFPKLILCNTLYFFCMLIISFVMGASEVKAASSLESPTGEIVALPDKPKAPDFTLTDTKGHSHTLSDYRGKVVVVNFWSVWCAPCRKEMPSMQRAWAQLQDEGVLIFAVNWNDDAEEVAQFFAPIPVDFPVLLGGDDAMIREWSVKGLPTTYVIDPQGYLVYRVVGEYEWDQPEALAKLRDMQE